MAKALFSASLSVIVLTSGPIQVSATIIDLGSSSSGYVNNAGTVVLRRGTIW